MGRLPSEQAQHVTLWSVLLHYFVVVWNTAITNNKVSYLTSLEMEYRWEREFAPMCVVIQGQTFQPIEEAMRFLLYCCPNPKCGAFGMCASFCHWCAPIQEKVVTNPFTKAVRDQAYLTWKAAVPKGGKASHADWLKANPKYATPTQSTSQALPICEAYAYLALNQGMVEVPKIESY